MYKIAICDDDKNYREKIEKVIETEGILPKSEIRFYEYESGKELLENADILHDLVFMDISMPEMDGREASTAIRALEAGRSHVPIVALTAHAMDGDSDGIFAAGIDRYLTKPLRKNAILGVLTEFCPTAARAPVQNSAESAA